MSNLVERLRRPDVSYPERSGAAWEAADEIERLRAALELAMDELTGEAWLAADMALKGAKE